MDLIWANREGKYFFATNWTGSISLIGLDKFAVRRTPNRRAGQAGLRFAAGSLSQARIFSRFIALQINAIEARRLGKAVDS
jgi:hypothetical protein